MAQVEARIRSTGGVADVTARELADMGPNTRPDAEGIKTYTIFQRYWVTMSISG